MYLVRCHSYLMVQLTGLLVLAPVWQQEDVACQEHIEGRPVVEEYVQPPLLSDGGLDSVHIQPA